MTSKIRNFEIQNRLGSGSYGVIFKAINKIEKQSCVLKQIRMNKMSQKAKKTTLMEATIMGKLNHPFIVQYKDSFVEDNTLHIIMQYCDNGDLSMFLKLQNKKPLKQEKIWKFFIQICMGLEYIHKNKILHRDIKTLNIFLNKNQEVKIGDLGVAKMLMSNDFAQTVVGTPFYLSPELCQQKPYNEKSDIWALGCLLYELCTYKHPFEAANQASLILKIIRGKYLPIPQSYSKQLKDMIDLCLQRDYKRRPTASMILSRQKIKQYIKEFNLEQKVNSQYMRIKANKQNKQPQVNEAIKQAIVKQERKAYQPLVEEKLPKKQDHQKIHHSQHLPSNKDSHQKVADLHQIQNKDDKKSNHTESKPNGLRIPQKNTEKHHSQSNLVEKSPDLQMAKMQKVKQVKQNKSQFMHNLKNAIEQPVKKRPNQKPYSQQFNSVLNSQKSRLQKIDNKIQDQVKKEKQLQKKKSDISSYIRSSQQRPEYNQLGLISAQKKQVKAVDHGIPPLPPKPKDQVIKVKMQVPSVVPKVYDSNIKKVGVIKTKGFNQEMNDSKIEERKHEFKPRKSVENVCKPVLFGGEDQIEKDKKQNGNGNAKHAHKNFQSEKSIKISSQVNRSSSKIEQRNQPDRYVFRKKPALNYSNSRVRKGSHHQISRNVKNISRYSEVTKQEEDLVANLPDHLDGRDDSDSQEENLNKIEIKQRKVELVQINDRLVLDKYEEILSSQSIQSKDSQIPQIQPIQPQNIIKNPVKINKNLNQYDQSPQSIPEQPQIFSSPSFILPQAQIQQKNQSPSQQQILDQSQQTIDVHEKDIEEEIQEMVSVVQQENHDLEEFSKNDINEESQQQQNQEWFQEDAELPLLEDKESPYFEQANPYLIPQQEDSSQQKKHYLQIMLEENIKRQDEINKLMQITIQECKAVVPKYFQEVLEFFRNKINMEDQYTENDDQEVEQFLKKKGLTDQRKFQNIYKILHFEMEIENTRKIIQKICKKLNQIEQISV